MQLKGVLNLVLTRGRAAAKRKASAVGVFTLSLSGFAVALWLALGFVPAPPLDSWSFGSESPELESKALFDNRGNLLSLSLSSDDRYHLQLPFEEISQNLVRSTLRYEDKLFFYHPGVNPISLVRGAIASVIAPQQPIGGSTISMQLARLRLKLNTRSIRGKLKQIFWALVLERHYSKKQILESYLNNAPYGANIEGIGAASLVYFRKSAKSLTPGEALTLAVLPQNPSLRWKKSGKADLESARDLLKSRFPIDEQRALIAKDFLYSPAEVPNSAPHFFQRITSLFPDVKLFPSNLDPDLQREAEEVLQSTLADFSQFGVRNGTILIAELPEMNIRAYVGSANYLNSTISGYVNGLAAERSPGSLLKPFIYGLAIDQGIILPETMLRDVPIRISSYVPENFERNFLGPIPARDALVRSRNIPALELFRTLASGSLYQLLSNGGVQRLKTEEHYGLALVLGGLGTTSEEISELYGALGNSGRAAPLRFLTTQPLAEKKQLLTPEAAYLVMEMLSKNPPALGKFKNQNIPWKTGTSYGSRDAWAVGVVGKHIVAVWLGEFDGKPNPNLVGRDLAGPVFFSVVDRLRNYGIFPALPSPSKLNLKKVEVCALSGALPSPDCPHRKQSWFIPGISPIKSCEVHRKVQVDSSSGLRLCPGEKGGEERVYEFWESNMQKLFVQAGLKRSTPPAYEQRCGMPGGISDQIRIISPEQHVEYRLEPHRGLELELLASTPGDSKELYWFADDVPLGTTRPENSLHWQAKVGKFLIRAVDDRGRSSAVRVRILPQTGDDATNFIPPS